ncbi:hypothetical protein NKDENANG_00874 [Candidatus Entotheonellaceae bacterium PAL068K]
MLAAHKDLQRIHNPVDDLARIAVRLQHTWPEATVNRRVQGSMETLDYESEVHDTFR